MDEKEILEQQVEALEKLLQLRSAIIEELEAKVTKLEAEKLSPTWTQPTYAPYPQYPQPYQPTYTPWVGGGGSGAGGYGGSGTITGTIIGGGASSTVTFSTACTSGGDHNYLDLNGGFTSVCTKCGNTFLSGTTTGYVDSNTNQQGGNTGTTLKLAAK